MHLVLCSHHLCSFVDPPPQSVKRESSPSPPVSLALPCVTTPTYIPPHLLSLTSGAMAFGQGSFGSLLFFLLRYTFYIQWNVQILNVQFSEFDELHSHVISSETKIENTRLPRKLTEASLQQASLTPKRWAMFWSLSPWFSSICPGTPRDGIAEHVLCLPAFDQYAFELHLLWGLFFFLIASHSII